jgi:hypothetical protein
MYAHNFYIDNPDSVDFLGISLTPKGAARNAARKAAKNKALTGGELDVNKLSGLVNSIIPNEPTQPEEKKKSDNTIVIVIGLLVVAGIAGYFMFFRK